MLWDYIGQVIRFAFRRSTVAIDGLQVIAASAIPAIAGFLGVRMAANATQNVLGYIGAIAVVFIMLRLLSAPYFIYRDQVGEIGSLRLELSKPERMVMEQLARHRAKARAKLAAALEDLSTYSFFEVANKDEAAKTCGQAMAEIRRFAAQAGLTATFEKARIELSILVLKEATQKNNVMGDPKSRELKDLMLKYLCGAMTAEELALQLPP